MKLMQTGRIFWQISPLLIFMFLPALAFGFWSALAATLLALLLHELAHVLAGKLLKVNTFSRTLYVSTWSLLLVTKISSSHGALCDRKSAFA